MLYSMTYLRRAHRPNRTMPDRPGSAAQRGFTLLEVLIAILVLAVGVLGMLGLQGWALRSNQEARYQAAAIRLGRDLGELMRSNVAIAAQSGAGNPYLGTWTAAPYPSAATCVGSACTTGVLLAQWDAQEWFVRAQQELPGIKVVVCFDGTPYDSAGLPQWACSSTPNTSTMSPVIKIGWTRQVAFNKAASDISRTSDSASKPGIIVPVGLRAN